MIENPSSPATQLSGLKLDEGWTVGTILERPQDATGGQFSIGYRASHPVHGDGFLKALDYSRAFGEENVAEVLQTMTEAFNFEVDIVRRCAIARLSRVALILASGQVHPPGRLSQRFEDV